MNSPELAALRERAKELRCLYRIHEVVSQRGQTPAQTFLSVLEVIPEGWQRPESTGARIEYLGRSYVGPGYCSGGPTMFEPIHLGGVKVGHVEVTNAAPEPQAPPFLEEEATLLRNIAHRIGEYLEWKHTELLGERVRSGTAHWRWRQAYAEALAAALSTERFGVTGAYLGGSTEAGDAGPGSDIDLFLDFRGSEAQRRELAAWLEGWSFCLAEIAHQQTGYQFPRGILNVRWIAGEPDLRRIPHLRSLRLAP